MSTSLSDFESQIQPLIKDRTSGTVETSDIKDALNRCIKLLVNDHGVYATQNHSVLSVFPTIYEYPLPSDFHDPINIQSRGNPHNFVRKTPAEFWVRLNSENNIMAIDTIYGDRFLLLKSSTSGSSAVLHDCESLTSNGTWAADTSGSDAANIALDSVTKQVGSGALSFDVTVAQSVNNFAAIENSTFTAVDLSAHLNKSTLFVWVYIPTTTNLSSFTLRWGSDSSNYYAQTVTAQFNGQEFRTGWNRLGFAWSGASTTGSPSSSAIDFLRFIVTYTASYANTTGFRVDDIRSETPEDLELHYYSTRFVTDADGTLQDFFDTDTDDESLLTDQDDDVLFYFALREALMIKSASENDIMRAEKNFERALANLKMRYGSDRKRPQKRYY